MLVKRHFQRVILLLLVVLAGMLSYVGNHSMESGQLPKIYFYDKSDRAVALNDFQGKVVLVNLWASWCVPCLKEMSSLAGLQNKLSAEKFQVVALSLDNLPIEKIRKTLDTHGAKTLTLYHDKDRQVPLKWKYAGLPTSFLLDRDGRIIKRYDGGYAWDSPSLLDEIGAALK